MDATTPLDVQVTFYFQFYSPTTDLPAAPSPAPTVGIVRLVDDTRTVLVAPGTALDVVSSGTGLYSYTLDGADNDADGVLIGTATTTDAAYTPYYNYANITYTVQAGAGGGATAADVWDYLTTAPNVPGSMKEFILRQLALINPSGVVFIRSQVDATGNTYLQQGITYTGSYRLLYLSTTTRDLSAVGTTVRLQFRASSPNAPQNSFPADEIMGSPGAWQIYVPITGAQSAALNTGTYTGQLAVYEGANETPAIASFSVTVAMNP